MTRGLQVPQDGNSLPPLQGKGRSEALSVCLCLSSHCLGCRTSWQTDKDKEADAKYQHNSMFSNVLLLEHTQAAETKEMMRLVTALS